MTSKNTKKTEHDFKFLRIIGEGSFSTVYLGKDVKSGEEYAIKACDKKLILKEKKQAYIKREKEALLKLNNATGVIQLLCTFQSEKYLFFVMSYAKNSELHSYLKLKLFDMKCVKYYSAQLLRALEEIHKRNIIHRDLKPQNLLLNSSMQLLIGDFGSSKILTDENYTEDEQLNNNNVNNDGDRERKRTERRSFVGTALYVSPEILKGNKVSFATDLFAYGCILYEMCCHGRPAFGSSGENEYIVFQKIQSMEYEFPKDFDPEAKDLVDKLLRINPDDRLGASDSTKERYNSIRNHSLFSSLDVETIYSQPSPLLFLSNFADVLQQESAPPAASNAEDNDDSNIGTGLGEVQLRRILQSELNSTSLQSSDNYSPERLQNLLEEQKQIQWSEFLNENEYLVKFGFVHKKKGLIPRKRMLLLSIILENKQPRLSYIDANANIKKGEIQPFDATIFCEPKNFKIFHVHTPNRIYFLESHEGDALKWCEAIEGIRDKYCK